VQGSLAFIAAIKTEVILSFLGLGIQNGVSWGLMLAESTQEVLAGQFNNFLAASLMLFALLMGFNLLADALQDALDPRQVAS
jgi:peptide/nickel transport system permease protein